MGKTRAAISQNGQNCYSNHEARAFRRWALSQYNRCQWCGLKLRFKTSTMDHIQPLARGGSSALSNACLSCLACNNRRSHTAWKPGERPRHGPADWSVLCPGTEVSSTGPRGPVEENKHRTHDTPCVLWLGEKQIYRGSYRRCVIQRQQLLGELPHTRGLVIRADENGN